MLDISFGRTSVASSTWSPPRIMDYNDYIQNSPAGDAKRRLVLDRANGTCEGCGERSMLAVHHLHYETLGDEGLDDLQALCEDCHADADAEREDEASERREEWLQRRAESLRAARRARWHHGARGARCTVVSAAAPALDRPLTVLMAE